MRDIIMFLLGMVAGMFLLVIGVYIVIRIEMRKK